MKSALRRLSGLAVVGVMLPGVASAAEGMPQLNFANPLTVMQAGWLLVIFLALYLLLRGWGLPQVERVLALRAERIRTDLDHAQQARADADRALADSLAATKAAHAQAQARIAAEVEAARGEAAAKVAELDRQLEVRLAEAEARIAGARAQAVGALREVAIETANNVVVRLLGAAPAPADLEQAVGSVIAARGA